VETPPKGAEMCINKRESNSTGQGKGDGERREQINHPSGKKKMVYTLRKPDRGREKK